MDLILRRNSDSNMKIKSIKHGPDTNTEPKACQRAKMQNIQSNVTEQKMSGVRISHYVQQFLLCLTSVNAAFAHKLVKNKLALWIPWAVFMSGVGRVSSIGLCGFYRRAWCLWASSDCCSSSWHNATSPSDTTTWCLIRVSDWASMKTVWQERVDTPTAPTGSARWKDRVLHLDPLCGTPYDRPVNNQPEEEGSGSRRGFVLCGHASSFSPRRSSARRVCVTLFPSPNFSNTLSHCRPLSILLPAPIVLFLEEMRCFSWSNL